VQLPEFALLELVRGRRFTLKLLTGCFMQIGTGDVGLVSGACSADFGH
jgi:hypothetical protein